MKYLLPLFFVSFPLISQNFELPLWPDGVPNHRVSDQQEQQTSNDILWVTQVQSPEINVYLPAKPVATGEAVVICPGGGYMGLAYDWEGADIAKWFNSKGIAGIVLKYRLPSAKSQEIPHQAPLQDAQQALRLVRKNASAWNIDPHKVGVMGFSAGGHLASTLGTHYQEFSTLSSEHSISARPDFMVLIYPVISMDSSITHTGSRRALLGERPGQQLLQHYSNELQVTPETPPTFLVHSSDDTVVPVANSIRFYQALLDHQIECEMHLYPYGGHGYSLALEQGRLSQWPELLFNWLQSIR